MSDENVTQEVLEQAPQKPSNTRGILGPGSNGKRLKELHRSDGKGQSLKAFMKSLAKDNPDVKVWFDSKRGKLNKKRSEANISMARLCATASRSARKKKKVENTPKVSE